nr:hypothetical protein [Tanacetum cinerariifolium]
MPSVTVDSRNATKEGVSPSVVDETVVKEKQSSMVDTTGLGSYPPLPTQGTTMAGYTSDKPSYANVTCNLSGTKVNLHTLFTTGVQFRRTSLTGFLAQSIRSSNAVALDSPYLLVLITGTSQSKQHGKSESDSYYLSD